MTARRVDAPNPKLVKSQPFPEAVAAQHAGVLHAAETFTLKWLIFMLSEFHFNLKMNGGSHPQKS